MLEVRFSPEMQERLVLVYPVLEDGDAVEIVNLILGTKRWPRAT